MKVLKVMRSPQGFAVIPIHYTADEDKRKIDWIKAMRAKFARPEEWEREFEINFESTSGTPAYPAFRSNLHLLRELSPRPGMPLCLCCDFNVQPLVWEIAQIWARSVYFLDEILIENDATVEAAVNEFRNRYPSWHGDVHVYGDASGTKRGQTSRTDYDLLSLAMRGYPSTIVMKVPAANPLEKDRLNAVNRKLLGEDGKAGMFVDEVRCPELTRDLKEVVTKLARTVEGGTKMTIKKTYDTRDPYSRRTHASDAAGYLIAREFPISSEMFPKLAASGDRPLRVKHLLGALR